MNNRKLTYILGLLISCSLVGILISSLFGTLISGSGGSIIEKVVNNYYLVTTDVEEDLALTYSEPADGDNYGVVVDATVFAVGYNDKYIIVKQHPRTFPNAPNKAITNFFILPIKKDFDWKTNNGLIGPLTLDQFNEKRIELNIPSDLKFTLEKSNLK